MKNYTISKNFIFKRLCILFCCLTMIFSLGCEQDDIVINANEINSFDHVILGNRDKMDYKTTKETYAIIAHVRIIDDLTNKNSIVTYNSDGQAVSCCSYRKAEVIKTYKNTTGKEIGTSISVKNSIGIGNDKKLYIIINDGTELPKGEYILFLNQADEENTYITSSNTVCVSDFLKSSGGEDIIFKTLLDYTVKERTELIDELIGYTAVGLMPFEEGFDPNVIKVETEFGTIDIQKGFTGDESKKYYMLYFDLEHLSDSEYDTHNVCTYLSNTTDYDFPEWEE